MRVHVHDNHSPGPGKDNCLTDVELEPGEVLTLHMHPGDCRRCSNGHCHNGTINLLFVDGALFLVLEGIRQPNPITKDKAAPHSPVAH